jgi:hypothetical protein
LISKTVDQGLGLTGGLAKLRVFQFMRALSRARRRIASAI